MFWAIGLLLTSSYLYGEAYFRHQVYIILDVADTSQAVFSIYFYEREKAI